MVPRNKKTRRQADTTVTGKRGARNFLVDGPFEGEKKHSPVVGTNRSNSEQVFIPIAGLPQHLKDKKEKEK